MGSYTPQATLDSPKSLRRSRPVPTDCNDPLEKRRHESSVDNHPKPACIHHMLFHLYMFHSWLVPAITKYASGYWNSMSLKKTSGRAHQPSYPQTGITCSCARVLITDLWYQCSFHPYLFFGYNNHCFGDVDAQLLWLNSNRRWGGMNYEGSFFCGLERGV